MVNTFRILLDSLIFYLSFTHRSGGPPLQGGESDANPLLGGVPKGRGGYLVHLTKSFKKFSL